jgi:precorrin-6B methylase 2
MLTTRRSILALTLACTLAPATAFTQTAPYEPSVGQPGKDVVWVPTPPELVEKMLDMAQVTPQDFVMDLGSGDGRNVIAAAKRGAQALGVEYNPDMVELSERNAKAAGVTDKARFVQGDMYEADISKATVLALFLLPSNLDKLQSKFLALNPGTRIVLNTFIVTDWEPDASETVGGTCTSWCTSLLVIVPAKVAGTWQSGNDVITFNQQYQVVSGTMAAGGASENILGGRLRGEQLTFRAGATEYSGRVAGDRIEGTATSNGKTQKWVATRSPR